MIKALQQALTFLRCDGKAARSFVARDDAHIVALWALGLSATIGLVFAPLAGDVSVWLAVASFIWMPVSVLLSSVVLVLILRMMHKRMGRDQIESTFFTLCILHLSSTVLALGLYVVLGQPAWLVAVVLLGMFIWTYMMYSRHLGAILRVTPGQVFVIWFVVQMLTRGVERLILT